MSLRSPAILHPNLSQLQSDGRESSSSLTHVGSAAVASPPPPSSITSTTPAASGGSVADTPVRSPPAQDINGTSFHDISSQWPKGISHGHGESHTDLKKHNRAESPTLSATDVRANSVKSSPSHKNTIHPRPLPLALAGSAPDLRHDRDSLASSKDSFPAVKAAAAAAAAPVRPSASLYHRRGVRSIDAIPRQTIMKALASRPPVAPPPTTTTSSSLAISSGIDDDDDDLHDRHGDQQKHQRSTSAATAPGGTAGGIGTIGSGGSDVHPGRESMRGRLSAALVNLNLDLHGASPLSASKLAVLASPCFYHKRFDDAVNIDRVLEEIQADETMSHSRLMQTATGVREVSKQLQRRPLRRAVHNILIITKARDNQLVSITRDLTEWLLATPRYGSEVGVTVYVDAKLRRSKRFDAGGLVAKDPRFASMLKFWTPDVCCRTPEKFDLVLTLGGDGTVLYTSWLFQRIVPPILSFSLGSLGFLTNFRIEDYKNRLDGMMGDEGMRVSLRMRFTCTVYRCHQASGHNSKTDALVKTNSRSTIPTSPIEAEQFEVLNELVIDRGPSPYVSNLELYGDDSLLTVIQADGCIFSTPTGSTAYSLSAGGSLVHPDIPAILLTPICPHTLSFRPMLLNDTMLLRVAVPRDSRATAYCSFDGKGRVELRQGDHVTIAVSQYPFPTVLNRPTDWFDSISRTLRWNNRGAQQKGWSGGDGTGQHGGNANASANASGNEAVNGEEDAQTQTEPEPEPEPEFDIDFEDVEDEGEGYNDCSH